ncbi:hypothetical protein CPB84DRAFT_1965294 [Gymnopilus junonius]|uniref:Heme haloperoxidase family profile domain-containing protein n=1 Tax=Gymnopilus junonius TaxID=109634 RepID=A0A9P5NE10_GYMJU|nr:hypothetical protein CPB84DRAFT_1965294 [Gymnopilus junonius]
MRLTTTFSAFLALFSHAAAAFPAYGSLAGLTREQLDEIIPTLEIREPRRLLAIFAPLPWLEYACISRMAPRNGIASPAQIVEAVQEGFNMENSLAFFVTYGAHLVDGNLLTDKLSIGGKTSLTGPNPPAPAIVGGLNTHAVFEADFFFGDNHDFNETLFDEMVKFTNKFGAGKYNLTVAGEFRWQRIQDSIATNPTMSFVSPRYYTAYADRMPDDFFRANGTRSTEGFDDVVAAHPIQPGRNVDRVNNYVLDPTSADFSDSGFCLLYTNFVNQTVRSLYPTPTGALRSALNKNLDFFFRGMDGSGCTQIFPFGTD